MTNFRLNFTHEFVFAADNQFGSLLDGINFNGMVGMLQRDEADVIVAELSLSSIRAKHIDYLTTILLYYHRYWCTMV